MCLSFCPVFVPIVGSALSLLIQDLFHQLKSAPVDSLTYRLALCMCLINFYHGGLRAVAHLWQEFVLELRYRWQNNSLIHGWVWHQPHHSVWFQQGSRQSTTHRQLVFSERSYSRPARTQQHLVLLYNNKYNLNMWRLHVNHRPCSRSAAAVHLMFSHANLYQSDVRLLPNLQTVWRTP